MREGGERTGQIEGPGPGPLWVVAVRAAGVAGPPHASPCPICSNPTTPNRSSAPSHSTQPNTPQHALTPLNYPNHSAPDSQEWRDLGARLRGSFSTPEDMEEAALAAKEEAEDMDSIYASLLQAM